MDATVKKARPRVMGDAWEKRARSRKMRDRKRWEEAARDADAIVRHIVESYALKAVVQWGSVLQPGQFDERSDIDLAVAGIPDAETFVSLAAEAQALTFFPLNLVEIDRLPFEFASVILLKGRVVNGQNS